MEFVDPISPERRDAIWAIMTEIGDTLTRLNRRYEIDTDYRSIVICAQPELTDDDLDQLRLQFGLGTPMPVAIQSHKLKDIVRVA